MEGVGGKVINVETMNKLKGELVEVYKIIDKNEAKAERLREKIAILENRQSEWDENDGDADDGEPEIELEMVERKAEEIIPKECWRLVFRHLDGEDLLSCRQVCKTFEQLLDMKEFKEKWQFKLILPHLFPYLKTSDPDGDPSWEHLYNPRLVCRSWRHSIDKYASEVYGSSSFPLTKTSQMPLVTRLRTYKDMEEFQDKFGDWNRSPFPSGSVYIESPREDEDDHEDLDWDNYWMKQQLHDVYDETVGELLEQFGKHISRLEWSFVGQGWGPSDLTLCKLVKRISTHSPNLREFIVEGGSCPSTLQVASFIAENPLEPLPKLQTLCVSHVDRNVKDYLLDAFGPQLTQLEITSSKILPTRHQMQRLKNVRKLFLHAGQTYDVLEPLLPLLQSPLELFKLSCLFIGSPSRLQTWNVDKFLRNLKHLPIESLEIKSSLRQAKFVEADIDLEQYKNSSIKTLFIQFRSLNVGDAQISFNFLQALTKLENLKLKFCRGFRTTHPEELAEVVKLNEYLFGEEGTNRVYQSNVWEKVPSLKTLTLSIDHPRTEDEAEFVEKTFFTREEYENYKRIRMIAEADVPEQK